VRNFVHFNQSFVAKKGAGTFLIYIGLLETRVAIALRSGSNKELYAIKTDGLKWDRVLNISIHTYSSYL